MSRVLAILSEDLGTGFALAGVEVVKTRDLGGAREALRTAMGGGTYGLIVVEEELLRSLPQERRDEINAAAVPLVIAIPGEMLWREEAGPADDYVARLIRRAVGYQLNIRL